jgi:DNA-binding beta-propeller fold protein YncE
MAVQEDSFPWGIAYCSAGDVIAVSLEKGHAVVFMDYESGEVKPEVTIGAGDSGLFRSPLGIAFSPDGRHILVADWGNHRVSKFSTASGAFIAHVATNAANGITRPTDVAFFDDGSTTIIVSQQTYTRRGDASVVCIDVDGGTVEHIVTTNVSGCDFSPVALFYSQSLNGVVVKTFKGMVFLLPDAWSHSSRSAWLSAVCI